MHLLNCDSCQEENTLDSAFCSKCGSELDKVELEKLIKENDQLVSDGQELLSKGRRDEALLIAESVLEIQPDSAGAWSLMGDCQEKAGQYYDAIAAYEQVVHHKPDSKLDQVRLEHLQSMVSQEEDLAIRPRNKKVALFTIIAGTLLLSSIGAAFFMSANQNQVATNTPEQTKDPNNITTFDIPVTPVPTQDNSVTNPNTDNQAVEPQNGGGVLRNPQGNQPLSSRYQSGSVNPNWNGGEVQPLDPGVPVDIIPSPGTDQNNAVQPNTNQNSTNQDTTTPSPVQDEPEDQGEIDISVIRPSSTGGAGADPVVNEADLLIKEARAYSSRGHHDKAAQSYEAALRKGASAGATNQRLAECYKRLGRRNDAINAYRRSIVAYDRMISSGNDSPRIRMALDECNKAIASLGG